MANIERRIDSSGNVKFRVRVRLRGNPKVTATFDKMADARRWASQTETAIRERRYFNVDEARQRTLAELITRYQKEILPFKSTNLHFARGQHNQLEWWKSQLGDYYISDVTAARISEARTRLTVSPSTINRYVSVLSHVFTVGICQWEWAHESPIKKLPKLREPRGRLRYLSDQEREAVLKAAADSGHQALHLIVVLALSSGARKGELRNLQWNDIDFARRKMIFQHTKNGERRSAPLGAYAFELLENYRKGIVSTSSYVFPSRYDTPMRIDREFVALIKSLGIQNFRFHDLRHSAASYLAMNGASVTDIAEVLGHKTLSMVKRYTHLSDSHTRGVVERMNAAIF